MNTKRAHARRKTRLTEEKRETSNEIALDDVIAPERPLLPDPWLMDSVYLLERLSQVREIILRIPTTIETYAPINLAIDAAWALEKDLRFLLRLHKERQRDFAKRHLVADGQSGHSDNSVAQGNPTRALRARAGNP